MSNWFDVKRRSIAINNLIDNIKTLYYCLHNQNFDDFKPESASELNILMIIRNHRVDFNPNKYNTKCHDFSELISFDCGNVKVYFKKSFCRISMSNKNFKSALWAELNMHKIKDEEIEDLVHEVQTKIIERF